MLWPIVLPSKITACVLLALVFVVTVVKWRRVPTFIGITLLSLIAFVPSCTGIMRILDADRFGVFEYASFDNVDDFRVERYLPPAATNITVDKYAQGFRARFTISQSQLDAYLDDVWRKYGDRSVVSRGEMLAMETVDEQSHQLYFGDLGWPYLDDANEVHGPTAGNGAGFTIWFSPSEGVAYQRGSYW
ncbi:hypothetical protein [Roseimaritima ulvae]|nr:hypothetical protein [Roseimaritima ulvae]